MKKLNSTDKILVTLDTNWADEMDINGFFVTTKGKWDSYLSSLSDEDISELYVGTNEFITSEDVKEYENQFKVLKITDEEVKVLTKLFGSKHVYGWNGKKHTKSAMTVTYGETLLVEDKSDVLWDK